MKVKHIIIILLISIIFSVIGALFKIQHWPYGGELLTIGSGLRVIALILGIWKVLTNRKFKDFLNS